MNARKILHDIVEKLPESELITAARILTALEHPVDPLPILLANAPEDDEPFDAAELEGIDDEPPIAHEEVVRRNRDLPRDKAYRS
jgi:hypothetical protein